MKTTTSFKSILTGLIVSIMMAFSSQSAYSQFFGLSYMPDSAEVCINTPTSGSLYWIQVAGGTYATGDSIDFYVDWGDGNNSSYPDVQMIVSGGYATATVYVSHLYTATGTYYMNFTATDELSNVFNYTDSIIVNDNCGHIQGPVRLDDGDNIWEWSDLAASGVPLVVTTNLGSYGANSDTYGYYNITNIDHSATTYQVEVDPAWLSANGFTVISPATGNYNFTTPPLSYTYYNFLLDCGSSYSDGSVYGYGWGFRPATADGYTSVNLGNFTCDGTPANIDVTITFDPMLTVFSCSLPGYSVVGNTLTATVNNVASYANYVVFYTVPPGTPASTPLVFDYDINVTNYTDSEPINNHFTINSEVRNSWDPNDKSTNVGPTIDVNTTDEIVYNIRFQNMGNDYAHDIQIVDTLDAQLDLSTFRLISMSHQGSYSIDPATRIVVFSFPDIMLPWESMSDPLSQGYVRYTIKENAGLPIGSELNNTAYIYFDSNPAVITNTTSNTNAFVGIENEDDQNPLVVYPQPASDVIYIKGINTDEINNIRIMDGNGKIVMVVNPVNINTGINISTLASGMYFMSVETNNGPLTKKLCVKK